jgi:hypothetical protein
LPDGFDFNLKLCRALMPLPGYFRLETANAEICYTGFALSDLVVSGVLPF